jgi:hypothetical protein
VSDEKRAGFFKDRYGRWQPDRRSTDDRRLPPGKPEHLDHERRKFFRRKIDREIYETDHRTAISDALDDFAEEHHGHL